MGDTNQPQIDPNLRDYSSVVKSQRNIQAEINKSGDPAVEGNNQNPNRPIIEI